MKKIALPVTRDNRIDDHFGHCEMYSIYTINEQNGIAAVDTITSAGGCGCKSDIAGVLAAKGVTLMIAGESATGPSMSSTHRESMDPRMSGNATEAVRCFWRRSC